MTQANRTLAMLLGLTAVGLAVGLYAWFGVFEPDRKQEEVKDRTDRLFSPEKAGEKAPDGGVPKTEFVKLVVKAKGDTTTLEREPGKDWRLTAPVQARADKVAVDGVVSFLQTSKFKHVVEEKPDDAALEKYGLKRPEFEVQAEALVGDAQERRTVTLEGGIENTYDGTIFVRRNGEPPVHAAEGGAKWTLSKSTFDLREKELVPVDDAKVTRVEVKARNNDYVLERDEKKNWKVTAQRVGLAKGLALPVTFEGDPASITAAISALKQDRAITFPADTPEARVGFEAPMVDATLQLEGGAKLRVRAVSPAADAGGSTRLLAETDQGAVLGETSGTGVVTLDRTPFELRDKRVLPFKKEEVAKVVFHLAGGGELVAEKAAPDAGTADSWRIVAPVAGPAKTFKIASVLWTIGSIKSAKLVEEKPKDVGQWGIDSKSRGVTLYGADGRELGKLRVGKEVPGAQSTSYMQGVRDEIVEADHSRLADLPASPADLLDVPGLDGGSGDGGR